MEVEVTSRKRGKDALTSLKIDVYHRAAVGARRSLGRAARDALDGSSTPARSPRPTPNGARKLDYCSVLFLNSDRTRPPPHPCFKGDPDLRVVVRLRFFCIFFRSQYTKFNHERHAAHDNTSEREISDLRSASAMCAMAPHATSDRAWVRRVQLTGRDCSSA